MMHRGQREGGWEAPPRPAARTGINRVRRQVNDGEGESSELELWFYLFVYLSFAFLEPHLRHMEVPRLGAETEL